MRSLIFYIVITILALGNCSAQKSNRDKLVGTWKFVEGWTEEDADGAAVFPKKTDSLYESINNDFRALADNIYFFYDGENAGSIADKDTLKQYPLIFINDSTYEADYLTHIIGFKGDNILIHYNPATKEYSKLKRED